MVTVNNERDRLLAAAVDAALRSGPCGHDAIAALREYRDTGSNPEKTALVRDALRYFSAQPPLAAAAPAAVAALPLHVALALPAAHPSPVASAIQPAPAASAAAQPPPTAGVAQLSVAAQPLVVAQPLPAVAQPPAAPYAAQPPPPVVQPAAVQLPPSQERKRKISALTEAYQEGSIGKETYHELLKEQIYHP